MKLHNHPDRFRTGTRVLFLKGRHKDGIQDQRMITRISHDTGMFERMLEELAAIALPHERIYASADARDLRAAAHHFKHAQISADFDGQAEDFYRHLQTRWVSSLMQPTSRAEKHWIFDCDSEAIFASLSERLAASATADPYTYATKSGWHIVAHPFDRRILAEVEAKTLHDNPLMLWGFTPNTPASVDEG